MIFKRNNQFNYVDLMKVTIIFILFLVIANSIEAQHMVGISQLKGQSSWYICSAKNTDFIAYNLTVLPNNIDSTPNFGNFAPGWPLQINGPPGVIVITTNSTEMMDYLNPDGIVAWYYANFSCIDEPVTSCIKTTDNRLSNNTVQCLGVTNPNSKTVTCQIDVNFNVPTGTADIINNSTNSDNSNTINSNSIATINIPIISLTYFIIILWTFIFIYIEGNF
ncbi:hypothetical protein RhiirC2_861929 [Rhizophagus irregularis]|uniref:Uncharacterized protein n=2 Tax=Rhizophagus irregularis TaxID=588596 RepID=A0A2N1NU53_9GLOM|nr:hypothetical protein RhiirC2_861929 [Rhizophagus irregularis]